MKQINKIKGVYLDGDEILYITTIKNNEFEVRFKGGEVLIFNVPNHTKEVTVPRWYGTARQHVIDTERIESEAIALKDSRTTLINQLVN